MKFPKTKYRMSGIMLAAIGGLSVAACVMPAAAVAAKGDMTIERAAMDSTIRVSTSARFAGAVSSIVFRGKEYVDTLDHGRELQSASTFDGFGECFNPTEAGGFGDGSGQATSSKLVGAKSGDAWLATSTDMAFWLSPGFDYKKQCGMRPGTTHALNKEITGKHMLDKRIEIGEHAPNVIADHVTFTVPEAHGSGNFEAATIYTPKEFSERYVYIADSGKFAPTTITGEQQFPPVLATPDGKHAVAIFSSALPQNGRGYGSFAFPNTNKLNCVFREHPVSAGQKFNYECDFVVGTLDEVKATLVKLRDEVCRASSQACAKP